jgi:hypothetical protein
MVLIEDKQYFAAYQDYCTAHKIISYGRDPVGFWDTKEEFELNANLILGAAIHKLALEGEQAFWKEYAVVADDCVAGKTGRFVGRNHKTWVAKCGEVGLPLDKVLRASEFDKVLSVSYAFRNSDSARWLDNSWTEATMRWSMNGLNCQGKADLLVRDRPVIVDLKTTSDIGGFDGAVIRYGYDMQNAFYEAGYKAVYGEVPQFIFVAVEKDAPYRVKEFVLDFFTLDQARQDMGYWMKRMYDDILSRREE